MSPQKGKKCTYSKGEVDARLWKETTRKETAGEESGVGPPRVHDSTDKRGRKRKRGEEQKKPELQGRMQYMQVRVNWANLEEDMDWKCERMRGHDEDRRSDE